MNFELGVINCSKMSGLFCESLKDKNINEDDVYNGHQLCKVSEESKDSSDHMTDNLN